MAADTAAMMMLGVKLHDENGHIARGEALGLGTRDLKKLKIKRIV